MINYDGLQLSIRISRLICHNYSLSTFYTNPMLFIWSITVIKLTQTLCCTLHSIQIMTRNCAEHLT